MFIIYLLSGYYYLLQGNESQVPFGGVIQYVTTDFVQAQLILNELIGALPPPPPPAAAYKIYAFKFEQGAGTPPPTVTELQNTLGAVVWVRDGVGRYSALLPLAVGEKYFLEGMDVDAVASIPYSNVVGLDYFVTINFGAVPNTVALFLFKSSDYSFVEWNSLAGGTLSLFKEIRIYPA